MKIKYEINKHYEGLTLIQFFNEFNLGKPKIHNIFNDKLLKVNDEFKNRDYVLKENDILEIEYIEERDFIADKKKLDVVFEDDYLLIVNKPSNILVHPDDKSKTGTMVNIVSYYYQNKELDLSIKYAHRLDIDTTGLLIFVKDSLTKAKIDQLISTHELKRYYLCLVEGKLKNKKGTINAPIGMDRHHKQRRRISKTGQEAITHYEVLKEFKGYSLLKVILETGRTHQIRVHLSSIGHPLLGDELYGAKDLKHKRFMLHSHEIEFIHPITREKVNVIKKMPFDMEKLVKESD